MLGFIPGNGTGAKVVHCEVELLYMMLPVGSSVVNRACMVYGNVGHFFVVLLSIRPQIEVYDHRVDIAGMPIFLLHQLAKIISDQLHTPN